MAPETKITVTSLESPLIQIMYSKGTTLWQTKNGGDVQMRKPNQNSYLYHKMTIIAVDVDSCCITVRRTFLTWLKETLNYWIDKWQDDTFNITTCTVLTQKMWDNWVETNRPI